MTQLEQMLKEVLLSPHNPAALDRLRGSAKDLHAYLASAEPELDAETAHMIEKHPDWTETVMAEIMEASEPETPGPPDPHTAHKIADDVRIGGAFRDLLLDGLTADVLNWPFVFKDVDQLPEDQARLLLERPDVRAAHPAADCLVNYGVTPLKFFYAAEGMRSVVTDRQAESPSSSVYLVSLVHPPGGVTCLLTREELVLAIRRLSGSTGALAEALLKWLVYVARNLKRPYMFRGLLAVPAKDPAELYLGAIPEEKPLEVRWAPHSSLHSMSMEDVREMLSHL